MYISLVNIPYEKFVEKDVAYLVDYNPMAQIINMSRYMILGVGHFSWVAFGYTGLIAIITFITGVLVFNKTEKTFIDTV